MDSETQVGWITNGLMLILTVSLCFLLFHPAHYGRYTENRLFSLVINPRLAWCVQECPSFFFPGILLWRAWKHMRHHSVNVVLLTFFMTHYFNRAFLYPWTFSTARSPVPLSIVVAAFCFTSLNGYLQAIDLCHVMKYDAFYPWSVRFLTGMTVASIGWAINWHSDRILSRLKTGSSRRYAIPRGGLFEYVSCANYFGECLEWIGWAVATQSRGGWCFAYCTCCNLVPRALQHHVWYHQTFGSAYPSQRYALIPFLL